MCPLDFVNLTLKGGTATGPDQQRDHEAKILHDEAAEASVVAVAAAFAVAAVSSAAVSPVAAAAAVVSYRSYSPPFGCCSGPFQGTSVHHVSISKDHGTKLVAVHAYRLLNHLPRDIDLTSHRVPHLPPEGPVGVG